VQLSASSPARGVFALGVSGSYAAVLGLWGPDYEQAFLAGIAMNKRIY
jgi:hypothetical protein